MVSSGVVYFITYGELVWRQSHPVVKIGCTGDLKERLSALSTGSPVNLISAGFIESENPTKLEKLLHKTFGLNRLGGEWFRLTPEMIRYLRGHYHVSDDSFSSLFDFSPRSLSALELENIRLKDEIYNLNSKIKEYKRQNETLNERLQNMKAPGAKSSRHEMKKFMDRCTHR